jgi:catechol 2,3-dioxygenase-like lactoylglutathione lyase family enzyme
MDIIRPRIVPELEVTDLAASCDFYVRRAGFSMEYERAEEGFAYISLDGAELMLEQLDRSARRFADIAMERPFGRGMNLQIEVPSAEKLLDRLAPVPEEIVLALEDAWYRIGDEERGNRQFVVRDPDGYLLRFFSDLGSR